MIEVEHLTRRYGELIAVNDVSFGIGTGEVVGLLGHNGAGKTTIMKMITGYLEPTDGRICIDGQELGADPRPLQARIGYLPENCPLWPEMTVIDYLDYQAALHGVTAERRRAAVAQAIRRTELASKATAVIQTLSRGYRQRVGVAQALLHDPDIIILDEPTNGLDPTQILHMRELIAELASNATLIVSTHILQEVQAVCGRVLILRAGELAVDARLDDLQQTQGLVVSVNGDAHEALARVPGVQTVAARPERDGLFHYHLDAPANLAPAVAEAIAATGLGLHALQPRRQDLETLFAQVNAEVSHG